MRADTIPTGLLCLDVASYIGGYPRGALVEVYGDPESGKTTLALMACREAQRAGGIAAYLDVDGTLDTGYAAALGVDVARLLVSTPQTGEIALGIATRLVAAGLDVLVIDAVAAVIPQIEIEGRIGDAEPGAQRRLVEQGVKALHDAAAKTGTLVLCVNQIRHVRTPQGFIEATAGGSLLPHRATMRVEVRRASTGPVALGIPKNNLARVASAGAVHMTWGHGFDAAADLFAAARWTAVISEHRGAFWFEGRRLGGETEALAALAGLRGAAVREAVLAVAPWRRAAVFAPL